LGEGGDSREHGLTYGAARLVPFAESTRAAAAAGCMLTVISDAHGVNGLDSVFDGTGVAKRAWVPPERNLNTLPFAVLHARLKRNRHAELGGSQWTAAQA
jgi:histidinol phosphatase-like PHP family hydrolase